MAYSCFLALSLRLSLSVFSCWVLQAQLEQATLEWRSSPDWVDSALLLVELDSTNRERMFVPEGVHGDVVRRPGETFNHRDHPTSAAQCTPDARARTHRVNIGSVAVSQLQNEIDKLNTEIEKEHAMKATLSEFVWAVLYSIAPLDTSDTAGSKHSPSRQELLSKVAELLDSDEGRAERDAAIKAIHCGNLFSALVLSFLKRAQHATGNRHVPFPPVLLHACLLIANTSPAAYAKLAPMFDGALPVARSLRSYNDTGDFTYGVNPTLYRKISDLVSACEATGASLHGTLSCDELSTIDVRSQVLCRCR